MLGVSLLLHEFPKVGYIATFHLGLRCASALPFQSPPTQSSSRAVTTNMRRLQLPLRPVNPPRAPLNLSHILVVSVVTRAGVLRTGLHQPSFTLLYIPSYSTSDEREYLLPQPTPTIIHLDARNATGIQNIRAPTIVDVYVLRDSAVGEEELSADGVIRGTACSQRNRRRECEGKDGQKSEKLHSRQCRDREVERRKKCRDLNAVEMLFKLRYSPSRN
jgi:hypothetical protein